MSRAHDVATPRDQIIPISDTHLPLFCPGPQAPLWSMHPRVYIEIAKDGNAICPYCSAHYQLIPDDAAADHPA